MERRVVLRVPCGTAALWACVCLFCFGSCRRNQFGRDVFGPFGLFALFLFARSSSLICTPVPFVLVRQECLHFLDFSLFDVGSFLYEPCVWLFMVCCVNDQFNLAKLA